MNQSRAVCQEQSAKNDLQLGCRHNINCGLQFVLPRPFQFLLLHSPYEEKPAHLLGRRPCPQHYCHFKRIGRWSNHSWKFEITTKESQKIAEQTSEESRIIFFFQCGSTSISVIFSPFPAPLAKITQFVFLWLLSLIPTTLVALGLTRIYLILKVNQLSRKELTWTHFSASRVHPA